MKKSRLTGLLNLPGIVTLMCGLTAVKVQAATSQLMDYFTPAPIIGSLSSTCWGAPQVGPRDQSNGLEDKTLANWVYWDGSIMKDSATGTYYLFAARWNQADGHNGWEYDSHCVYATSNNLYGPYTDQGLAFTDNGGAGHNVGILQLKAGDNTGKKYAITLSGGVPGSGRVYGSNSLSGPWSYLGDVSVASGNSFSTANNMQIILRPDGKYEAIESGGKTCVCNDLLGPYVCQPSFYSGLKGIPNTGDLEDPTIWYSGGRYHWVTNEWDIVKAFHFTSLDGSTNWTLQPGHAYDAAANFISYTDGTVNHWKHIERPRAYVENGHVAAFTFAAINVEKADDLGNDQNGSKVIVVPFDGAKFDSDTICATFWPNPNYIGSPIALKPGNYTTAQLSTAGIPGDSVYSIMVSGGLSVEIYTGDNFSGTKCVLNSNTANFGSTACNHSMSSVKVIDSSRSTTIFNAEKSPNFGNSSILIPGFGAFRVDNASSFHVAQFMNLRGKKVLEIPINSGVAWEKFDLPNGLYIMTLYGKDRTVPHSFKVIIKR